MAVENLVNEEADKDMMLFRRNAIATYQIMRGSPESDISRFVEVVKDCYNRLVDHYLDGNLSESDMIKYSNRMDTMNERLKSA